MAHPSEDASFKLYDLFFIQQLMQPFPDLKNLIWIKIAFSGQHEQNHLSKNVKKFGCDKKINLRNQLVKKPTIYDLFIIGICSLQNVNKHSSEMKNKHQNSPFTTSTIFPSLELIFYAGQKLWLSAKFFRKLVLLVDCPTKNLKVSQVQSNSFIFQEIVA